MTGIGKALDEPYAQPQQPVSRAMGYSSARLAQARPARVQHASVAPAYRYRWADTYATLLALKESEAELDPYDGIRLSYTHPLTGGATVSTYACELQLLTPRLKTQTHRHHSTTIYHVYRGAGATVVGDERLEWAQGDIFVVPPWWWHSHENRSAEDAVLYSITDWPTMAALDLYREEAAP